MKKSKGRHAVVIFTTPEGWKPTHWHSVPFAIEGAEFLARRLKLPEAVAMARKFNKAHLPGRGGAFGRRWAVCIKNLRASKWQGPPAGQQTEGGADHA